MFKRLLKILKASDDIIFLAVLAVIAIIIRTKFLNFQSYDYTNFFSSWLDLIKYRGIFSFKYDFYDYTPLYVYFLGIFTLFFSKLYAIKIFSIIFDFVLAFFTFLVVKKKYKNNRLIPILSFVTILFAPTVILNGSYWGQCDVIYTSFLVASVYFLLKEKPLASLIFYGISFSLKLQSIFLLPLFVILLLRKKIKLLHFLAIPLVYFITIIPAGLIGRSWRSLLLIYQQQVGNYNFLTLNAPSLYQWIPQYQFDFFYTAGIFFAAALVIIFIYTVYKNRKEIKDDQIIKIAFLSVTLLPFLLPKMHERFFFPADIFSIIFAFYFPEFFLLPIAMQAISFLSYSPFLWGAIPVGTKIPYLSWVSLAVLIIILLVSCDLFKNLSSKEVKISASLRKKT